MQPARAMRPRGRRRRRSLGWLFAAPYLLFLIAFGIIPVAFAVYNAFVVTPVFGPSHLSLTENIRAVLTDFRFLPAARNVLVYLALSLPLLLLVVFALALVTDARRTRLAGLTRFVAYVPGAVTGSAAALLWLFMFSPSLSPVGGVLANFSSDNGLFVSDATLPLILTVMGIAAGAGGWIVVLFGALTAIPGEILDAARVDGASAWQTALLIKLPIIRSYAGFILIVSFASGFQVFVEPQLLAVGARGQLSSTWSLNQLVYFYATTESNYGRASALAVIILAVCVVASVVIIKKTNFYSSVGKE